MRNEVLRHNCRFCCIARHPHYRLFLQLTVAQALSRIISPISSIPTPPLQPADSLHVPAEHIEMLTMALLRTSPGISITRLLRTCARNSYTTIAGCGLPAHSRERSSVTFPGRVHKDGSHIPTTSPSYKIFGRPFHASAVCRANCDWGRPCICSECSAVAAAQNPICQICNVNPTVYTSAERGGWDRKGIPSGYTFISLCAECADKREEENRIRAEARKEIDEKLAEERRIREEARNKIVAAHTERVAMMLRHVRSLPQGEQVPIAYAVEKVHRAMRSKKAAWVHKSIRTKYKELLQAVRVRKRWMCDKGRVDAMDFRLYSVERDQLAEAVGRMEARREAPIDLAGVYRQLRLKT